MDPHISEDSILCARGTNRICVVRAPLYWQPYTKHSLFHIRTKSIPFALITQQSYIHVTSLSVACR